MIVIDVGCATYGEESSIDFLIGEFQPTSLFGFDPNADNLVYQKDGTTVVTRKEAAWIRDGHLMFVRDATRSRVAYHGGDSVVCFDLAALVLSFDRGDIILKMDAEGSEYTLLPHLHATGADSLLKLAWVEWHCLSCGKGGDHREGCEDTASAGARATIESLMRCEMRSWHR